MLSATIAEFDASAKLPLRARKDSLINQDIICIIMDVFMMYAGTLNSSKHLEILFVATRRFNCCEHSVTIRQGPIQSTTPNPAREQKATRAIPWMTIPCSVSSSPLYDSQQSSAPRQEWGFVRDKRVNKLGVSSFEPVCCSRSTIPGLQIQAYICFRVWNASRRLEPAEDSSVLHYRHRRVDKCKWQVPLYTRLAWW